MGQIALFQPLDKEDWERTYFKKVRSREQLQVVADDLLRLAREYATVLSTVTAEDSQEYVQKLVIDQTFEGWEDRRGALKSQLTEATGISFSYLRDHPQDWRPREFCLDFAAQHPVSGRWLGIKVVPDTIKVGGLPGVEERLAEIKQAHEQFADRWSAKALLLFFEKPRNDSPVVQEGDIRRVVEAWDEISE